MKTPKVKKRKNYWKVYTSRRDYCIAYSPAGVEIAIKFLAGAKA